MVGLDGAAKVWSVAASQLDSLSFGCTLLRCGLILMIIAMTYVLALSFLAFFLLCKLMCFCFQPQCSSSCSCIKFINVLNTVVKV